MRTRFLIRLFLFFSPLITLGVIGEWYDYYYFNDAYELKNGKPGTKTLITGTSQAEYSIISCLLEEPAINIASPQRHFNTDRLTVYSTLEKFPEVSTVALELTYAQLELPMVLFEERKASLLKYYNVNLYNRITYPWDRLVFSKDPRLYYSRIVDSLILGSDDLKPCNYERLGRKSEFSSVGYNLDSVPPKDEFFAIRVPNDSLYAHNSTYLLETIDNLVERDLNVVIFITPKHPLFHDRMNPIIVERRAQLLSSITARFPDVKILNREMDTVHFKTTDFRDHNHLNDKGAIKFTRMFDSLLNNIQDNSRKRAK